MNDYTGLLIGVLLLLGNAFFVGAEFAIISARRSQIEPLVATSKRAHWTLKGMENVSLMLAGAQLGITVCSLGLGAVAEPALAHIIEPLFESWGLPTEYVHVVGFVVALTFVVYLHIVIGEMVPKNLALSTPERSALWLGPMLWWIVWVLRPVIWVLNEIANVGLRVLRVTPKDEVTAAFTAAEVATLIAESGREGLLDSGEVELAAGALELNERPARALVIPPHTLRTVSCTQPASAVLAATVDTGFSRFPVVDGHGDFLGYLHVRDVLDVTGPDAGVVTIADLRLRPLPMIAAAATAASVAEILRTSGSHLARVLDADGTVCGIITLEDVLEELIGEVHDSAHRAS